MSRTMNPVLGREITERLRGLRAFVALALFVLVLTLTAFLVYSGAESTGAFDLAERTRVGRLMFETVILIMTVLVLFFVPGLTAAAVAGERERETLATMQVTLLRPRSILLGKIAAALSYVGLLLIAALPVLAVSYVLGGIRVLDLGRGLVAVALLAVLLATMIVALSSFTRRVQTATVAAYAFTALLVIAGPLVFTVLSVLDARSGDDATNAPPGFLAINPVVLVADLATGSSATDATPLSAIMSELGDLKEDNDGRWFALFPDTDLRDVFDDGHAGRPAGAPSAWLLSTATMSAVAALMFWRGARRLRTPAEVER